MSAAVSAQVLARVKEYAWMLPVASPIAFIMAWGMGANELSSNWGNVFGSRVLIVLLAALFEFTGAMALGSGVASTIRGSIISSSRYANAPEQLMFGFLVVLITCSVWLIIVNAYGLPVSDSQTTVLSLVGVGIASRGWDSIRWDPGMRNIGLTWVSSPFSAALLSAAFFYIVKIFILQHKDATLRAKRFFPVFVFVILFINIFWFVFETPAIEDGLEAWMKAAIAAGGALFFTLVAQFTYFRWVSKKMDEVDSASALAVVEAQSVSVAGTDD
ncbi:hypothetical protein HDU67_003409, partial [Dinochytrium kinnereticum]